MNTLDEAAILLMATYSKHEIIHRPGSVAIKLTDRDLVLAVEYVGLHVHLSRRERVRVLEGSLLVVIVGLASRLDEGDAIDVNPRYTHELQTIGEPAIIELTCDMPWSTTDHWNVGQ